MTSQLFVYTNRLSERICAVWPVRMESRDRTQVLSRSPKGRGPGTHGKDEATWEMSLSIQGNDVEQQ
jgi:hypothetical protein